MSEVRIPEPGDIERWPEPDPDEEWPECPNCQDEGCTLCTPDCVEEVVVKAADHPNDWSATLYRHRE